MRSPSRLARSRLLAICASNVGSGTAANFCARLERFLSIPSAANVGVLIDGPARGPSIFARPPYCPPVASPPPCFCSPINSPRRRSARSRNLDGINFEGLVLRLPPVGSERLGFVMEIFDFVDALGIGKGAAGSVVADEGGGGHGCAIWQEVDEGGSMRVPLRLHRRGSMYLQARALAG